MTTLLFFYLILFTAHSGSVYARLEFVGRIPNGNNVGAVHALGHVAWDGSGPLNAFGKAFAAAGNAWTKALCQGDADGDGQTNGEELGDPCCEWLEHGNKRPRITDVLSHPGDFGSKLNETDLRARTRACPVATTPSSTTHNDASSASSRAQEPPFNRSSSSSSRGADDAIRPPVSAVPIPIPSSSSSPFDRVSLGWSLAATFLSTLLVSVIA